MDPLGDPLTTHQIDKVWKFTIEPCPTGQFGANYNVDSQFCKGSHWTWIVVKARTPALGYVGIRTVIEWIWLQTWTRVIIGVVV